MTSYREVGLSLLAFVLNLATIPAHAHPAEPLVETTLTDPDPGFVAAPAEKRRSARPKRLSDENPTVNQAFENLGRVVGQVGMIAAQAAKARAAADAARAKAQIEAATERAKSTAASAPQ